MLILRCIGHCKFHVLNNQKHNITICIRSCDKHNNQPSEHTVNPKTIVILGALALGTLQVASASETTKSFLDRWDLSAYIDISAMRSFQTLGSHHANPMPDFPTWNLYLPKASLWATYDIGKGWSAGTQIEFENNGTVASVGEGSADTRPVTWDAPLSLSELWIQKSFSDAANIKIGFMGSPVGRQNDMPFQFFGTLRPEDGPSFLALNNNTPAIGFNGEAGCWSYDIQAYPGFMSWDFGNDYWRRGLFDSDQSYTQSVERLYGGAFLVNYSGVKGLLLGLSGEMGSGHTRFEGDNDESLYIRSLISLASLSWDYEYDNFIFRGAWQYAYVSNSDKGYNPSGTIARPVDLEGMSVYGEVGYDVLGHNARYAGKQKLYIFGRYSRVDYRNYHELQEGSIVRFHTGGQRFSFGLNWYPLRQLVVKGECGFGFDADPSRIFAGLTLSWMPFN